MQVQESLSRSSNNDNGMYHFEVLHFLNNYIYHNFIFLADCVFNPWGTCSRTCGGGIQTRDFSNFAKNDGAPCIGPTLNYCNPQACPLGKILRTDHRRLMVQSLF